MTTDRNQPSFTTAPFPSDPKTGSARWRPPADVRRDRAAPTSGARAVGRAMVATVCGESMAKDFAFSLFRLRDYDLMHEGRLAHGGWLCLPSANNIASARNAAVRAFLETDLEWLFFVDSDQTFEPDVLDRLIEAADPVERPILSALVVARRERGVLSPAAVVIDPGSNVLRSVSTPPPERFWQCLPGTGCIVFHRTVFERMADEYGHRAFPFFEFSAWEHKDDSGRVVMDVLGEDFTAMLRANGLGFTSWVDTTIEAGHLKTIDLRPSEVWKGTRT